jgi:hypothetical protein
MLVVVDPAAPFAPSAGSSLVQVKVSSAFGSSAGVPVVDWLIVRSS